MRYVPRNGTKYFECGICGLNCCYQTCGIKNHLLTLEIIALLRGAPVKRVFDDSFKGVKLSDKRFRKCSSNDNSKQHFCDARSKLKSKI